MILVQNGNHKAFSCLYDRYAGRLKGFFYRMLWSNGEMAEDYVHDLFSKLIEKPELYNADKSFSPWLFQVAANMCKNAYRKRSFEEEYLNQLEKNQIQVPNIEQVLDEQLLTDQVYIALERLEEDKRELFLLRYQQEFSVKELAEIYEVSEGTIKSRLFYVRKVLVEMLSEKTKEENEKG